MDLDALVAPLMEFLSTDLGQAIARIVTAVYEFLYPSNAEAAHPVEIPE